MPPPLIGSSSEVQVTVPVPPTAGSLSGSELADSKVVPGGVSAVTVMSVAMPPALVNVNV